MRRLALLPGLVVIVLAAGCDRTGSIGDGPTVSASSGAATGSASDPISPTVGATAQPPTLPPGVPETFDDDVAARDLPVEDLAPSGDDVTAVARTRGGQVEGIVITFATPGPDPFRMARGFVVWRRDPGADPPWRAVYGMAHQARDGVLAISADATDLTGDGSADALIREETGGTGQCATYRVVDIVAGAPIWQRGVCDGEIQPNPDPIGLYEVTRVYGPADPHCCPSAIRERVLAWDGARFAVVSRQLTPLT